MAMGKKGSRALVVDGRKYRWGVRFTVQDTHWSPYGMGASVTVTVEDYAHPQSMLCVSYACGYRYWPPRTRPRSRATGLEMEITPWLVAKWIRDAQEQGWNPNVNGGKILIYR